MIDLKKHLKYFFTDHHQMSRSDVLSCEVEISCILLHLVITVESKLIWIFPWIEHQASLNIDPSFSVGVVGGHILILYPNL